MKPIDHERLKFEASSRHAQYYLRLLYQLDADYLNAASRWDALDNFELERLNIEHARQWTLKNRHCHAEIAQWCYWFVHCGAHIISVALVPEQLLQWHLAVLPVAEEIGNVQMEAATLGNIGNQLKYMGRFREALKFHRQGLKKSRQSGDTIGEGQDLANIGLDYLDLGYYRRAYVFFHRWHSIALTQGNRRAEARALKNMGMCLRHLDQDQAAWNAYAAALRIAEAEEDEENIADIAGNAGNILLDHNEGKGALELFERALQAYIALGNRRGEVTSHSNIARAHFLLRGDRFSLFHEQEALALARNRGDIRAEAYSLYHLGMIYHFLGDGDESIRCFEEAIPLLKEAKVPELPEILDHLQDKYGIAV